MRETLVKNGIQERISDLIGDGESTYSAQASIKDNINRIHASLVGDAPFGRIMAGLDITLNSNVVSIGPGYGITIGGNLIKFATSYEASTKITDMADGNIYRIYIKYYLSEQDEDHEGKMANFVNSVQQRIIKDQVGAKGEAAEQYNTTTKAYDSVDLVVVSSAGAAITVDSETLYVGSIEISGTSPFDRRIVRPNNDNSEIEYTIDKEVNVMLTSSATGTVIPNAAMATSQSLMIMPSGTKRIKYLSILRLIKSTSAERSAPTTPYNMYLSLEGVSNGGVTSLIQGGMELADVTANYSLTRFSIEDIIQDDIVAIRVRGTMSATTTGTPLTSDYEAGYGDAKIACIIEKLT